MTYKFKLHQINKDKLKEVSSILEKTVEIESRKKFGKAWDVTDKISDDKSRKADPIKKRARGIVYSIAGILFLIAANFVPYRQVWSLAGIAMLVLGILFLIGSMFAGLEKRFDASAELLIDKRNANTKAMPDDAMFLIDETGILGKEGTGTDRRAFASMDYCINSENFYTFVKGNDLVLLQKDELVESDRAAFEQMLQDKVKIV